ncbi:MAG: histidine phosphatase family protein [Anaerolineales bacterium]|nr:histidine phosphatase family protein [Anaerolineales bacterium]
MPTILLIRHGENDYVKKGRLAGRLPGVHLNEAGRKQAEDLVQTLGHAPLKAVYSSPLERAMETAAPLAQAKGLDILPRAGLLEVDFGEWQDKTLKALQKLALWKVVQGRPSLMRFPAGETFAEAQQRIVNEIITLAGMHAPHEVIACFSHSDLIKLAAAYFLGTPLDLFQRIMIGTASITTLHFHDNFAAVVNLNYSPTLQFPKPPEEKKSGENEKG